MGSTCPVAVNASANEGAVIIVSTAPALAVAGAAGPRGGDHPVS